MQLVSQHEFGQVFITDASAGRVERIFEQIGVELKLFKVAGGEVVNNE
jgi:DNA replication and repair protein RecF